MNLRNLQILKHNKSPSHLNYKIYTAILKNCMQKSLDAVIGENQSAVIKNRTILHIFSTIQEVTYVSNKLNSNLALISLNVLRKFALSEVCSSFVLLCPS